LSSSTTMELTSAGAIALITYCAGSSSHKITSIALCLIVLYSYSFLF
jgi:hypothetical protein